jgi:hypothetical protein
MLTLKVKVGLIQLNSTFSTVLIWANRGQLWKGKQTNILKDQNGGNNNFIKLYLILYDQIHLDIIKIGKLYVFVSVMLWNCHKKYE